LDHYTKIIIISQYKNKEEKSKYPIYKRLKELLSEYNIYFFNKSINELENTISNIEDGEILFIDNSFIENNKDLLKEYLKLVDIFINDISKEVYISDKEILKSKSLNIF
jgi:3-phosphoglycerate kinase